MLVNDIGVCPVPPASCACVDLVFIPAAVVVVVVLVRVSVLLRQLSQFVYVAVRTNTFLNAIRISILSGRSSSSASMSSCQYSFGGSLPILRSISADEHSFECSSGRYSCGS